MKIRQMLAALLLSGVLVVSPPPVPGTNLYAAIEVQHSEMYIADLSVEDVIIYFDEVCLDSEYTNSGDPSVVQKWTVPIRYQLYGEYTQQDLAVIEKFESWLNQVEGFEGMSQSTSPEQTNMRIYFCEQDEIVDRLGEQYVWSDGGVTYWYEENQIYDAIICCRKDIDQHLRNSVLLEELYNSLGAVQDTLLREDSIIYQHFAQPQEMTEVDELILRLLYHPDMLCGMNAEQCAEVIRSLYY